MTRSRFGVARKVWVIVPCLYSQVTTRIPRISVKIAATEATLITSREAMSLENGDESALLAVAALPMPVRSSNPSTSPSVVRGAVRIFNSSA